MNNTNKLSQFKLVIIELNNQYKKENKQLIKDFYDIQDVSVRCHYDLTDHEILQVQRDLYAKE